MNRNSQPCRLTFTVIGQSFWRIDDGENRPIPNDRPYELMAYLACCKELRERKDVIGTEVFKDRDMVPIQRRRNINLHEGRLRNGQELPRNDTLQYPIGWGDDEMSLLPDYCECDLLRFWQDAETALAETDAERQIGLLRVAISQVGIYDPVRKTCAWRIILPGRDSSWPWVELVRIRVGKKGDELLSLLHALDDEIAVPHGDRLPSPRNQIVVSNREALPPTVVLPKTCRLPHRSLGNGFVGRTEALWRIHDSLSDGGAAVIEGVGAVIGAGGIGKSQLAVEYAHRFATYYPAGIIWIDAGQGRPTFVKQLSEGFADEIPIIEQSAGSDEVARLWHGIAALGSVLIILDDFPKDENLRSWLPPATNIHVLITSRRRDLHVTPIPLDFLTETEGLALLNTSDRRFGNEARWLLRRLGGLPLAIELAKSYLNLRPEISVEELLDEIDRVGEMQALSEFARDYADELPTGHEKDISATFQISWDLVSQVSQDVLKIMSLVESMPVPRSLLRRELAQGEIEGIFAARADQAVTELNRLSLVDLDEDADPTMHSLIRAFVKTKVGERGPLQRQLAACLKGMVEEAGEDQVKLRKIVPHTVFVFRSLASDDGDIAASRDEVMGLTIPLVSSALNLTHRDSVESARSSCIVSIQFLTGFRQTSPSTWTAALHMLLAGAYLNLGNTFSTRQERLSATDNYTTAIELLEECDALFGYNARTGVLGSIARANRAQISLDNGSIEDGLKDVEALLDSERMIKKRLGPDWPIRTHSQLARSLSNLLHLLVDHGCAEQALSIRQLLVSIVEVNSDLDWASLNSLGVMYLQDQEWSTAEATLRKSVEAASKSNSDEGFIKSRNNLAISLRRQRKLTEAERVCEEAVQRASHIGDLAWECQTLGTLASVLRDQGKRAREADTRNRIQEIRKVIGEQADDGLVDV